MTTLKKLPLRFLQTDQKKKEAHTDASNRPKRFFNQVNYTL
ncbi:hypothetical protein HanXRQr2_Chr11g0519821 [Helianthus annuus]|uniref:Uncharacterized protein n=1 Tax=Helianthus annuus TaxID=4232 RepID=A0A9K3N2D5_HELAN|nr:hypothetical protein HanXRQr2_Chr11g0519821 [Helianthus annuus]KAJ0877509.1 hypothetical protein HanPSC8_Chr11g0500941 [Helianthus annuus]